MIGGENILTDFKALWKAFVVILAVSTIWYGLEFKQYGTLQWDRQCDNVVSIIYMIVLWHAYHKNNNYI